MSEKEGLEECMKALNDVANRLTKDGWSVDRRGYRFMFRVNVKDKSNQEVHQHILSHLPTAHLAHTSNLGHLDIHIVGCGKYPSVRWLLSHLQRKHKIADSSIHNSNDSHEISTCKYIFMGDDTNDVEVAKHAALACIVTPCSDDMRVWLDSLSTASTTTSASASTTSSSEVRNVSLSAHDSLLQDSAIQEITARVEGDVVGSSNGAANNHMQSPSVVSLQQHSDHVFTANAQDHRATEALLEFVLSKYRS